MFSEVSSALSEMNVPRVFATFVVSDASRAAFEAAQAVAETSERASLLLVGRTGSGKTHLLRAIAERIGTSRRVLLVTGKQLVTRAATAVRQNDAKAIDRWLGDYATLLVDDLLFRSDERHTRAAIMRYLERANERGTQIVAAAPEAIDDFAWDATHEVGYPDLRAREELVRRVAAELRIDLSERAVHVIAANGQGTPGVHAQVARAFAQRVLVNPAR